MTTIELPESDLLRVNLEPVSRQTLGSTEQLQTQRNRLSLGQPVYVPLDLAHVDDDAKTFLASRQGSQFFLVSLTASFEADDENPLETAWVDVTLRTQQPEGAAQPVAWSMKPTRESDPMAVSRKVALNPTLEFPIGVLPVNLGPGASVERTHSFERALVSVEAIREGTSKPRWEFFDTDAAAIRGVYRLLLVAETAVGSTTVAEVGVGATIRLRRLKVFRYRAEVEGIPEVSRVELT